MKRLERFLWGYSGIIKVVVALFWIFWTTQLFGALVQNFKEEMKNQKKRPSIEEQVRISAEMDKFIEAKIATAKAKGAQYRPKDYFDDLYEIDKLKKTSGIETPFALTLINQLQRELMTGHFSDSEISVAAEEYKYKRIDDISNRKEFEKSISNLETKTFLRWLATLYLRSLLLALTLYLVRMSDRKGILQTVLADKKRFLLALFGWPLLVFRYPHNVIREIIVEAELRRLGGFFRRLSAKEKRKVRQVAAGNDYGNWIARFRVQHGMFFRRSLAFALLAVVVCSVLPAPANAEPARGSPALHQELHQHDHDDDVGVAWHACPPQVGAEPLLPSVLIVAIAQEFYLQEPSREIEHVPLTGCFA